MPARVSMDDVERGLRERAGALAMPPSLIDTFLPEFNTTAGYHLDIPAPPDAVYTALRRADLAGSPLVRALFALRGLPSVLRGATETRVQCLDTASRRSFRRYWRVVGPFSGLIRWVMLRAVREAAVGV